LMALPVSVRIFTSAVAQLPLPTTQNLSFLSIYF
jgi:hypothetical protein